MIRRATTGHSNNTV